MALSLSSYWKWRKRHSRQCGQAIAANVASRRR